MDNNDRRKRDDAENQKIRADIDGWPKKRESWPHPQKDEDKLNYKSCADGGFEGDR